MSGLFPYRKFLFSVSVIVMMVRQPLFAAQYSCDVLVNGGSFSAPAAALAAARANPSARILLVEPTDWLGGQATSQGVSAIDNCWHNPGATLMRTTPTLYYAADYLDFLNRMKNKPAAAPGTGMAPNGADWVTREAFDPRTGAWTLDQMIAETSTITVLKMTVVKNVQTADATDAYGSARRITGLTLVQRVPRSGYTAFSKFLSAELPDWYSTADSADFSKAIHNVVPADAVKGMVVIDASELADVVVLSGATYTVGREKTTEELNEDGSLPTMDELGSQATVFPFCMTDATATGPETELKAPWADFDTFYQAQSTSYFSMGSTSWARIWTYRRLLCAGALSAYDTVNRGDVSMQNWYPGNDYPYGSIFKDKADAAAELTDWQGGANLAQIAGAEKQAMGWYFFMKNNETTTWDTRFLRGNDSLNMMGTNTGLSKFPYMRCVRRIIGLDNYRLTGRYFVNVQDTSYTSGTSYRFFDSVGIGNYATDVHPTKTSTGLSPAFGQPAPFYIPYRALGSTNVRNLLAAGKNIATTYITNSGYRLHPIEWAIGSASGTAAGMMTAEGRSNRDLLNLSNLRRLQTQVKNNSPISWAAYDTAALPSTNGDLVVNDFKAPVAGQPSRVEIYHPTAVRARIFLRGTLLAETTTRANGRLLQTGMSLSGGGLLTVQCFDGTGALLDTFTTQVADDSLVIDDTDARFSTTGATWSTGTAQANKYGTDYRYIFGTSSLSSATWLLNVPAAGRYEIALWYPESGNRATDAPFTVYHSAGQTTVKVNQQINGGTWFSLGKFQFSGTSADKVVLTNQIANTAQLVVADAIRVTPEMSSVSDWQMY